MQFRFPTEITVLEDAFPALDGSISSRYSTCLIVTGGSRTQSSQLFQETYEHLKQLIPQVDIFGGISSNPTAESIAQGALAAKDIRADCVFGVGGGSVLDASKLIAVLARQHFDIEALTVENQGYLKIGADTLPVITIPLLAGTGTEISPASLVRLKKQKRIVFSPHMHPAKTFYSLRHMFTADANLNIMTAFDAFVQGLEAFVSKKRNTWSDMFSSAALSNSIEGIMKFSRDPDDLKAREQLAFASSQGLLAVANSSVGAIHALSDPLSGLFDIHHGRALALVAPSIIEYNYDVCRERYQVVEAIFEKFTGLKGALSAQVVEFLRMVAPNWKADVPGLDRSTASLTRMTSDAQNPDMDGTPKMLSEEDIRNVFATTQ